MSYDNVKLWFAKDINGDIVTIDDVNLNNTYSCPMCGSDLRPKAIKSRQITSHFAHVDASKCDSESMVHWWFKHKFIVEGDEFTITSDKERKYTCKKLLVEQSYSTAEKLYKPDVTVITECGKTIYFEMNFSNKKKVKDYLDIWLELKNIVVEVDIKSLMFKDKISTFKALFYDGKCFNVKKNDLYYNTIGKYKEEKLKGKIDSELKERVKRLDWFWKELLRFKKGESSIEQIYDILFYLEDDKNELEVAYLILKNKTCSSTVLSELLSFSIYQYSKRFSEISKAIESEFGELFQFSYNFSEHKKEIRLKEIFFENASSCVSIHKSKEFSDKKLGMLGYYSKRNLENDENHINKNIMHEILHVKDKVLCSHYADSPEKARQINEIRKKINRSYIKERKRNELTLLEFDKKYKINSSFELEPYSNTGYFSSLSVECNGHFLFIKLRKTGVFVHKISESGIIYQVEHFEINEEIFDEYLYNLIREKIQELYGYTADKLNNEAELSKIVMDIEMTYEKYGIETTGYLFSPSTYNIQLTLDYQVLFDLYITNLGFRENYLFDYDKNKKNDFYMVDELKIFIKNNLENNLPKKCCKSCQTNFALTLGELKFLTSKSLQLPHRCKKCRELRKKQRDKGVFN